MIPTCRSIHVVDIGSTAYQSVCDTSRASVTDRPASHCITSGITKAHKTVASDPAGRAVATPLDFGGGSVLAHVEEMEHGVRGIAASLHALHSGGPAVMLFAGSGKRLSICRNQTQRQDLSSQIQY